MTAREIVAALDGDWHGHYGMVPAPGHSKRDRSVKVMDGYAILEIESPHNFAGKVLQELDLRKRFGINVLAVKRRSTDGDASTTRVWVPESTDRLEDGDVLVLLGKTENINNLRTLW